MKHGLLYTLGPIALIMVAFATSPAQMQQVQTVAPATVATTAVGPYYATPAWDQQLPASTRFIVLSNWGNAAVLDRETGLVWERSPSTTEVLWAKAPYLCNNLAVSNRKGWRLPTIQELASLVDMSVPSSPKLPSGHPFMNVQSLFYTSATTYAGNALGAWYVGFGNGLVSTDAKSVNHFVWCVRGGQGVDPQ